MALAYATGQVNGLNALWDALDSFLTTAAPTGCGWSKTETVNTRDAIYKTTGTDGKINAVYRLMVSTSAGNPYKVNYNFHKKMPLILGLAYSSWAEGSPGTGTKPYGQVGPVAVSGINGSSLVADLYRLYRYNGTFPLPGSQPWVDVTLDGRTRKSKSNESYENPAMCFDGRRKFIGANTVTTTQISWADLVHGESNVSSGGIPPATINQTAMCLVHDTVNDRDLVFVLNNTATLANQLIKFDMETKTWSTMVAPTWTASVTTGSAMVWDGNDTIYLHHGNSTTEFAKYSISGNTWTNLTASPSARSSVFTSGSTGCMTNTIYVPASVTGLGEDVIYIALLASGTVIFRYDVTSNAWRSTSGTGALTAQQTIGASFFLLFDGIKTIVHGTPNAAPGTWYMSDASVAPNTWTSMGSVQSALRNNLTMQIVNHIPAKVRSHATLDTKYWFLGNQDACVVVTKVLTPTPHYYWMYLGRFNSSNRTTIMTTTGSVTAGGRVSIPVDDSSAYSPAERVLLFDPSNSTSEVGNIFSIPDATHIVMNINNNYASGTRIGLDPTQWCAAGNGYVMVPTDAKGYNTDHEPCQMILEPSIPASGTDRSSPGSWGLFQPNPYTLFNPDPNTSKYGNRGFAQNIGALSNGAYPKPQPEDTIKINKKTYIYFEDTETKNYTTDTRGLVIGPID